MPTKPDPLTVRQKRIELAHSAAVHMAFKIQGRWAETEVPKRHREKVWQYRGPEQWVEVRDRIIRRIGSGFLIVLLGKRGPGKTQLAVDACRSAVEMRRTARYVKVMELLAALRLSYNKCDLSIAQPYLACGLLVVDCLEVRCGDTNFEQQTLTDLLDRRYDEKADTILVSNLRPTPFKESVGVSIVSRITETGDVIECTWESFR